jgi:hypothetical protein
MREIGLLNALYIPDDYLGWHSLRWTNAALVFFQWGILLSSLRSGWTFVVSVWPPRVALEQLEFGEGR